MSDLVLFVYMKFSFHCLMLRESMSDLAHVTVDIVKKVKLRLTCSKESRLTETFQLSGLLSLTEVKDVGIMINETVTYPLAFDRTS